MMPDPDPLTVVPDPDPQPRRVRWDLVLAAGVVAAVLLVWRWTR